ncbi:AAA family ATPase, partial [Alteromonas sp. NFXS44]|uniref:ATP-binding protein n=1 Tax=Alteromonas sp. NFXS44 TaxID=2818435 RepID=UPI0032E04585
MRWSKLFVGRKKELSQLIAAYDKAFKGNVQIVPIVAETGFGKTRLAQELYNWLSVNRDPAGEAGYWPDLLERIENNLTVNPPAENCGQRKLVMPYLWWGLRIPDPGARNEIISGALWPAISSLKPHLAQYQKEVEKRAIKFKALKEGAKGATSLGFDVLGNIVTFGLLGAGKTIIESGIAFYNIHKERVTLEEKTVTPNQTNQNMNDELSETIISDLRLLACPPSKNLPKIPLVLLLDDAQWLSQDQSTLAFFEQLIVTAKQENWPLLLIITCWEKEWHDSEENQLAPAKWLDRAEGDSPILLGSAKGLENIISKAFSGLVPPQIELLLDKADGNPRFLDEILMFLDRSPKYFKERDQSLPLSLKGEKAIAEMNFADLVLDRFEAAPENVRKVLALSSLQGMSFSPRISELMAESAAIAQASQAISYSETPLGFTSIRSETATTFPESKAEKNEKIIQSVEFRLKAYREAAIEDLENHIDEISAHQYFAKARQQINLSICQSSNIDLEILMAFVEEPQAALAAAAELIKRANEKLDNRAAASIAANVMPLLKEVDSPPPYDVADKILNADSNFHSVSNKHLEIVDRFILMFSAQHVDVQNLALQIDVTKYYRFRSRINYILSGALKAAEDAQISLTESRLIADKYQSTDAIENLAISINDFARILQVTEGPKVAKPLFVEVEQLMRALAEEIESPSVKRDLALATFDLATVTRDIDGSEAAKPLFVEVERLMRILAEDLKTPSARKDLASATAHLANVTRDIGGPEAAKPLFVKYEQMMLALAKELKTPSARMDLANAISRLATLTRDTDGPEAAKPLFVQYEQLMRTLASELKIPIANKNLALAIYHLASVMHDTDGPETAKPLFVEVEQLMKALAEELNTPGARKDLADATFHLATVTYDLDGPETARPLFVEYEQLKQALADELKTPDAQIDLINATAHLANVTRDIGGPEAAKPLFVKYEQLMRALAEELKTPGVRRDLANANFQLATVMRDTDGPEAAKPLFVKYEQLMRTLADELKTPNALKESAYAAYHLATVTRDTDGPETAKPLFVEVEQLMKALAEELNTPGARKDLADATFHLANLSRDIDGPEAAKPLFVKYEQLMRALAEELKTPGARKDLSFAIYQLATVMRDTDGPKAAKPLFVKYERLMRTLADELKTPNARKQSAYAAYHLATVTRDTDGPETAKPLFVKYEQLMWALAEELKTPGARKDLADATFHLANLSRDIDGPEAAEPLFLKYERLMRALAEELKTPAARKDFADATYHLATVMRDLDGPEAAKPLFVKYEQLMRALAEELKTPGARKDLSFAIYQLATVM